MRRVLATVLILLTMGSFVYGQSITTYYNFPPEDTVLSGLTSIRGMGYNPDPFGDGHSAFLLSNYYQNGLVHLFTTVGNDSIQLVWTSPILESGGYSTPRYPIFGDLDNDGLIEIIYQVNDNGVLIFEWDGVAGSYNFGDAPSQVIEASILGAVSPSAYAEQIVVEDVDGDGVNELLIGQNVGGSDFDAFSVISASGNWSTGNPGFSGFTLEAGYYRNEIERGAAGGSSWCMFPVNFDGQGNPELLLHTWNFMNVIPVRVTGADTYEISDSTGGHGGVNMGGGSDDVALFGGMAYDIDGDGREEAYLPVYYDDNTHNGWVYMVYYNEGDDLSQIDENNWTVLDIGDNLSDGDTLGSVTFGYGYGDIDGDGITNLYFSSVYPWNLVSAELVGSDKTNPADWEYSVLYPGEDDIYSSMTITDSAGVVDTDATVQTAFASKIWARFTDFDKDGNEDILMPYQAINDSVDVTELTWNDGAGVYDTTEYKYENPKRWSFRILEAGEATGIEAKDLKIIMPDDFVLEQNYPNPFNPVTAIRFSLPVKEKISLKIYDLLGNEIRTLVNSESYSSGAYEVEWDGMNNFGKKVASGQYIYRLEYGNFSQAKKMTLLK